MDCFSLLTHTDMCALCWLSCNTRSGPERDRKTMYWWGCRAVFVFEDAGGVHLWCTGRLRMITNNLALGFCTGVWVLVLKLVSFPLFPYGAYSWKWRPNLSSILWSICNNKCYMAKYSGTSPRSRISCTSLGSPRLEAADSATDLNVQWCPRWGGHFSSAFQAEWGPCVSMSYWDLGWLLGQKSTAFSVH